MIGRNERRAWKGTGPVGGMGRRTCGLEGAGREEGANEEAHVRSGTRRCTCGRDGAGRVKVHARSAPCSNRDGAHSTWHGAHAVGGFSSRAAHVQPAPFVNRRGLIPHGKAQVRSADFPAGDETCPPIWSHLQVWDLLRLYGDHSGMWGHTLRGHTLPRILWGHLPGFSRLRTSAWGWLFGMAFEIGGPFSGALGVPSKAPCCPSNAPR